MTTERDAPGRTLTGDGWVGVVAEVLSRSYLVVLATLGAIVLLPGILGWTPSVVQSESMAPNVSTGDVVVSSELPESSPLPVGGVVTFRMDDRTVVHRMVAVRDDESIVTAGDANPQDDPWSITRKDITGQARVLVPYVGLPGLWLQRGDLVPLAGWLLVTVAAVVCATLGALAGGARRAARHREAPPSSVVGRAAGAAALAGLLAVSLAVVPLAQADAAFTGSTRASASWKAKSYSPISIGSLGGYGAVASSSVQDTGSFFYQSAVVGDIATTPGTSITGFRDQDAGTEHKNDQGAKNAMASAVAVRTALAERPLTATLPAALSGTLGGGVYASTSGAFSIAGTLTLDAKGDPSARFVFRTTTTLTMAQRARVVLAGGALAANVWWVVGTSATLGSAVWSSPDTTAVGNYLVGTNAALQGVLLSGRVVAFAGTVSLSGRIAPTN